MNSKAIIKAILVTLLFTRMSMAQGGPYLVDSVFPQAWPNPVSTVEASWLDSGVPTTVLAGQTIYVQNTTILAQKQKDYYWFQDKDKQNGTAHKLQIDNNSCRVWLEWEGYFFPSNGLYDCEYDAIPFYQLDPKCFYPLSGPYCDIPNGVTYVGQVNGFPWVAFGGMYRKMGGKFTETQIDNIFDRNLDRNQETLRSDLRAELVDEFLALHPEINPSDIPVDNYGDTLTLNPGNNNTAVVAHILPAIAPEGNGAGRNAYSNAMVVSSHLSKQLIDPVTGTGYMPSDAMLLYFEYLTTSYDTKQASVSESKFTATFIRDLRVLNGQDIEYLTEEETRVAMQYAGLIRPTTGRK